MPINTSIPFRVLIIGAGCLATTSTWPLRAQAPSASPLATPNAGHQALPELPNSLPASTPVSSPAATPASSPAATPEPGLQALPQTPDTSPTPTGEVIQAPTPVKHSPTAEPGDPALNTSNSFWLDNYPLNDLFQYLSRQADYQFFQNPFIDAIRVTGELFKGNDPLENMRELALQYNLVLFQKGRTIYALTQDQITTLPQQEYRYELKYLHPRPEDIQRMLGHFLTPDHGSATLEPQINTIVVSDNETVLPKIARYLKSIDVPRRQISIQVRVISITTTGDKYTGVDWSQSLGAQGVNISGTVQANLDSAFGFRAVRQLTQAVAGVTAPTTVVNPVTGVVTTTPGGTAPVAAQTSGAVALGNEGTNVILGPTTVAAVLHALYDNTRAHEENAPLVITEDNQTSTVRVVTRQPIVTSTVNITNGVSITTNEVRYYLDPGDAAKNREIGTTLLVTPSILPDNTIRLQIDGTVASIVGSVSAATSATTAPDVYPIVNEAHLVNLSRVPSGYSLILGGFVTINNSISTNRVPILSSIPLLGQAFRFKQTNRSRTNLAFIITPIAFQAENPERSVAVSEYNRAQTIGPAHDLADPDLLGRVNENATDFHNAISTGQESEKNPVKARKSKPRKKPTPSPQSGNPDEQ